MWLPNNTVRLSLCLYEEGSLLPAGEKDRMRGESMGVTDCVAHHPHPNPPFGGRLLR